MPNARWCIWWTGKRIDSKIIEMNLELSHDAISVSCDIFFHTPSHHLLSQVEMEFVTHKTRQQERGIKNQSIRSENGCYECWDQDSYCRC